MLVRLVIGGARLGACLGLEFRLPVGIVHAIDNFARCAVFYLNSHFSGFFPVPAGQAIPAEPSKVHHVYILHIRAVL